MTRPTARKSTWTISGNRVQRISQDALEGHAAFSYRGYDTAQSCLVSTMPAADLHIGRVETAIPICAWRSAAHRWRRRAHANRVALF